MAIENRFKDNISIGKIGTGGSYMAGSFKTRARKGLAGALRAAKTKGARTYTKNLSGKDLKTFQGLIGDELKKQPKNTGGLSRTARRKIMQQAEQMRKQGTISTADKKDLKNIVDALGSRAQSRTTDSPNQQVTAGSQPSGKAKLQKSTQEHKPISIKPIITRNLRGGAGATKHDPRSALGKLEQVDKGSVGKKKLTTKKEIDLPDIKNLPDMDIG